MTLKRPAPLLDAGSRQLPADRYQEQAKSTLESRRLAYARALRELSRDAANLACIAQCLVDALADGHSVLIAGNGGSAAEAQHFAAELVGRFKRERSAFPVMALTADSAILTAVGNDYGFEQIFGRQVRGHGRPGDVLIVISTSGESCNLIEAVRAARERHMRVIAMTGRSDCTLANAADYGVSVPGSDAALAQEVHMLLTHVLCDIVENELAAIEEAP